MFTGCSIPVVHLLWEQVDWVQFPAPRLAKYSESRLASHSEAARQECMFTVYILKSDSYPRTYTGYSDNFNRRFSQHNKGQVIATVAFRPWSILYTELHETKKVAKQRELYWKSGAGRKNISRILVGLLPSFKKTLRAD